MKDFFRDLIEELEKKKITGQHQLNILKNKISKKHRLEKIPTNIEILCHLPDSKIKKFKRLLITKPTRTISGVAVCAIMTKPIKCPHGKCVYCPGGPDSVFGSVPQSYTGKEPATRRAIRNLYDPYLQVMNRLEQYVLLSQDVTKVELIVMGGTFPSFSKKYQDGFIKYSFKAMNDFSDMFFKKGKFGFIKFKEFFELPGNVKDKEREKKIQKRLLKIKNKTTLKKEQKRNEKSDIRCVGLTIETRPDYAKLKHGNEMLRLGATRVELGVQTIYDDVLKKIKREHSVKDSIEATRILKDLGFKINYHVMPGLPGVSRKKDLFALKALFAFEEFQPDMLKIYPCMVLKGTKLYDLWKKKRYVPLTTKQAAELIAEFKKIAPEYLRIMRVQRDIPSFMTEAGVDKTNLRQYIGQLMKTKKVKCKCIRCREPKSKAISKKIKIIERHYIASCGNEFFISAEDVKNDVILGFCRLRFPSSQLRKEITQDSALIRELHVYGEAAEIGKKGRIQHKGIGKALIERAEKIARTYYKNKMIVISGIGAREYFRKLGYKREGPYMSKRL